MAKKTILELVQKIGHAISSDEIDTLGESQEAFDIIEVLKQTYDEVLDRRTWEFMKDRVLQLDARLAGDNILTNLKIPDSVLKIQCLRYLDDNDKYRDLTYMSPCDFVTKLHNNNPADVDVTTVISPDGVPLYVKTNKAPQYWTSFDEANVTMDSYEGDKTAGVIAGSSAIIATIKPVATWEATALLPIPERMETLILNEAIASANYRLRQTADPRSERIARRQGVSLRENEPKTNRDQKERHYGRRTSSGR
jgi:hypothetical protein